MSKSKNNGVDPQDADRPLRRRHRAPVHDVRRAAGGDAGVERRRRGRRATASCAGSGTSAASSAARAARRRARPSRRRGRRKALRFEIHTVLKQVDYDYQRMQYNTVVSGAMKMLNALEDFKGADEPGAGAAAARRLRHPAARAVPGRRRTSRTSCGRSWATRQTQGDLLDAPWPKVDEAALEQDEIELVLQVNGKLRGVVRVPAGATRARDREARASPARTSSSIRAGRARPRK